MVTSVNVGDKPTDELSAEEKAHNEKMIEVADRGVSSIRSKNSQTGENVSLESETTTEGESTEGSSEKAERPADIPEKFWDAEKGAVNVPALLKAQQDAETALRNAQNGKPTESTEEKPEGDVPDPAEGTPKGETASQQAAIDKAADEFAEKGELGEETYKALEATGLSKTVVDQYIEGARAIASQLESSAYAPFDGKEETYTAATNWASENMSAEEIEALNLQLTHRNPAIVAQGAKALAERYEAEADLTPGRTLSGGGNDPNAGAYFKSSSEMQKAMADPRYRKDESFRKEVERKIERSDKRGVNLF